MSLIDKLAAVNQVIWTDGQLPVSALDSSGSWPSKTYNTSDAGLGERILDQVAWEVQSEGWAHNVVRSKKYTTAGGAITFAASVIRAVPAGPSQFKNIGMRAGAAYDLEADTGTFAAGDYFFDITSAIDFADCDETVKLIIMHRARERYQQMKRGDPIRDAFIKGNRNDSDVFANRPKLSTNAAQVNPAPRMSAPLGGGQQGQ